MLVGLRARLTHQRGNLRRYDLRCGTPLAPTQRPRAWRSAAHPRRTTVAVRATARPLRRPRRGTKRRSAPQTRARSQACGQRLSDAKKVRRKAFSDCGPALSLRAAVSPAMDQSLITVRIPSPLRASCKGAAELSISGVSVRAVFGVLESQHPALYRSVCDETGRVRPHIGLFVNSVHLRDRGGIDTPLSTGDVVSIFQAVSGG